MPAFYDRVKETTTTTGTGTITLAGAVTGYRTFTSVLSNGALVYYAIVGATTEWEVGIGTFTTSGTTLARTTVLASSNSNAAVDFSAGSKDVFIPIPAQFANRTIDFQYFGSSTNWSKPDGAKTVDVILISGACGGGSGATGAINTGRKGGGGGGPGLVTRMTFPASALASSETITIGAGSTGGTAVSASDTAGNSSGAPGSSYFGGTTASNSKLRAMPSATGNNGSGQGTPAVTDANTTASHQFFAPAGGTPNSTGTGGNGGYGSFGPSSGAAGGGITTGNAVQSGGTGGGKTAYFAGTASTNTGGAGGTSGGNGSDGGAATTNGTDYFLFGVGGGGGASSIILAAGNGGNGSAPGGGGGGGGAALNTFNSGAGGNGADGGCYVITTL